MIAERMGIRDVRFQRLPLPRMIAELRYGNIDMGLRLAKNPEREAILVYPASPFTRRQAIIAVRTSHPLKEVRSADDLTGLKICSYARVYRPALLYNPRLKFVPLYGENIVSDGLNDVLSGVYDAYYEPHPLLDWYIRKLSLKKSDFRIMPLPIPPTPIYPVFSKQAAPKYLGRYEAAAEELGKLLPFQKFVTEFMARSQNIGQNQAIEIPE